jgi:hypothetical protein
MELWPGHNSFRPRNNPCGFTRGQSGYACATAKSGEKGSVLDMGQDTRVSCLGI